MTMALLVIIAGAADGGLRPSESYYFSSLVVLGWVHCAVEEKLKTEHLNSVAPYPWGWSAMPREGRMG